MENGLVYLCKNREIKEIEFRERRQNHLELVTLIEEDFLPLYVKYYDSVNHSIRLFNGDKDNLDEWYNTNNYEPFSLLIDYLVNNKSFDATLISDSQFIPRATEIYIGNETPPLSATYDDTQLLDNMTQFKDVVTAFKFYIESTWQSTTNTSTNVVAVVQTLGFTNDHLFNVVALLTTLVENSNAILAPIGNTSNAMIDVKNAVQSLNLKLDSVLAHQQNMTNALIMIEENTRT